jgi:hypothetical protein
MAATTASETLPETCRLAVLPQRRNQFPLNEKSPEERNGDIYIYMQCIPLSIIATEKNRFQSRRR